MVAATILAIFASSCDDDDPGHGPPPLRFEDVDRACTRIASCQPAGSESPGDCAITALTRPASGIRLTRQWIDCLDGAGSDCDAVTRCGPQSSGDPCQSRLIGTSCQGDLLMSCFGGNLEFVTDCSAWGLGCAVIDGEATCQGDGPSCLLGDEACEGSRAIMCLGFREARFDCARLVRGRTCQVRSGRAFCVAETESCTTEQRSGSCEATSLGLCSAGGGMTTLDCTALGFQSCAQTGDRAVCGAAEP